ncbi:MAG: HAMP domain-containing protein [Deltaproteobacteria bacterium]|nr:HAMP domain-containing protein [Deltaproteobacteria bacterium]
MKLARKLTLALVLGMCAVLAVHSYLRVQREVDYFQEDMKRDHLAIGHAFGAAVAEAWRNSGEDRALEIVEYAGKQEIRVKVRWVRLDAPAGDPQQPALPRAQVQRLSRGMDLQLVQDTSPDPSMLYTYIPVVPYGMPVGALELTESLEKVYGYVRTTIWTTLLTTLIVAAVCGLMAWGLGLWLVGRPMNALIGKARRVGAGDLSGPLELRQRDELAELAGEMNAMCDQLAGAQERLADETASRIVALDQLRHADRLNAVGKLASGIAHELGTPLNVVAGRAKMIATKEVVGDEALDNAKIIVEQSERMAGIIRQLLDFARRRGPQRVLEDLRPVVDQTLSLVTPLAQKQRVELEVKCHGTATVVKADLGQLQQALTNLVVNGIQAMPQGGKLSVDVQSARVRPPDSLGGPDRDCVCVSVRDEGAGIPPNVLQHIFDPFFTTKGVGQGTGLGLSVSEGIIREHGGWIGVESEMGKGSCFTIYLPAGDHA